MSEPSIVRHQIMGLESAVCVAGTGSPVIALHGWGATLHTFWPVAEKLQGRDYAFHLLDLPGFGDTQLPPEPWGVAEYMQYVLSYLDNQELHRVDLLGHSFGGRISIMLAAEYPERVGRLVLANSAGLRAPLSLSQQVRNVVVRGIREGLNRVGMSDLRQRLQDGYNQRYASEDYLSAGPLKETFLKVIEQDLADFAVRIKAPTILIWGDQDKDTPLWQGRRLEQLIPDAGLIVFEGAGHYSYLDRLGQYVRIVDHFLSEGSR